VSLTCDVYFFCYIVEICDNSMIILFEIYNLFVIILSYVVKETLKVFFDC